MKQTIKRIISLVNGALWLVLVLNASAATTIYNNSVNDIVTRFNPGTTQVGDQIKLAGTDRMLTMFSFEYWGTNTVNPVGFVGTVQARVRLYENTGTPFNGYNSPGATSFYDSGLFNITATERSTLVFNAGTDFPADGLFLPSDEITWTVEFSGMSLNDSVGLDIYSPPTVGQDYPDYWAYNGSSWLLMTNAVPMNFAARMDAVVPEPSTAVLSLLGGVAILFAAGRLRRATV